MIHVHSKMRIFLDQSTAGYPLSHAWHPLDDGEADGASHGAVSPDTLPVMRSDDFGNFHCRCAICAVWTGAQTCGRHLINGTSLEGLNIILVRESIDANGSEGLAGHVGQAFTVLLLGSKFLVPLVLVQETEEDFEVDWIIIVKLDDVRICFLLSC